MILKNFKEEIEKVIKEHENDIINFYTRPSSFFSSNYSQYFVYNQCTYYPKGISKKLAIQMEKELNLAKSIRDYDVLENRAIHSLKMYLFNYRPCLVQHRDAHSLINKGLFCIPDRITAYFKDYLDKYNIDYNNPSEVFANLDKLNYEKEEFINQIRKETQK